MMVFCLADMTHILLLGFAAALIWGDKRRRNIASNQKHSCNELTEMIQEQETAGPG